MFNIVWTFLSHLSFPDDIVIISDNIHPFQEMTLELMWTFEKVGLEMNLTKTKQDNQGSKLKE